MKKLIKILVVILVIVLIVFFVKDKINLKPTIIPKPTPIVSPSPSPKPTLPIVSPSPTTTPTPTSTPTSTPPIVSPSPTPPPTPPIEKFTVTLGTGFIYKVTNVIDGTFNEYNNVNGKNAIPVEVFSGSIIERGGSKFFDFYVDDVFYPDGIYIVTKDCYVRGQNHSGGGNGA